MHSFGTKNLQSVGTDRSFTFAFHVSKVTVSPWTLITDTNYCFRACTSPPVHCLWLTYPFSDHCPRMREAPELSCTAHWQSVAYAQLQQAAIPFSTNITTHHFVTTANWKSGCPGGHLHLRGQYTICNSTSSGLCMQECQQAKHTTASPTWKIEGIFSMSDLTV